MTTHKACIDTHSGFVQVQGLYRAVRLDVGKGLPHAYRFDIGDGKDLQSQLLTVEEAEKLQVELAKAIAAAKSED